MTVTLHFKANSHHPRWWERLRYFRVWFLWVPCEFEVWAMRVTYSGKTSALDSQQLTQINKAGRVNWGLPGRTKNGKSWHPNSMCLGYSLQGWEYAYDYAGGVHSEKYLPAQHDRVMARPKGFSRVFAYFMPGYIGGTETLPEGLTLRYAVTFRLRPFWRP